MWVGLTRYVHQLGCPSVFYQITTAIRSIRPRPKDAVLGRAAKSAIWPQAVGGSFEIRLHGCEHLIIAPQFAWLVRFLPENDRDVMRPTE